MPNNKQATLFGKSESMQIKGVVIILMLIHHLFGLNETQQFVDSSFWKALGGFGKICVSVYAFLSGYGLFLSLQKDKRIIQINRILKLLFRYWICLTFIIVIEALSGDIVFSSGEIVKIILNYFCIFFSHDVNAWFILPYFCFVLLLPIAHLIIDKISNKIFRVFVEILCIILPLSASVLSNMLLGEINYIYNTFVYSVLLILPFFSIGTLFAKYSIFDRIGLSARKVSLNLVFGALLLVLVFFARKYFSFSVYGNNVFDILLAPLFVFALTMIFNSIKIKWVNSLFFLFGTMSTNIWLFHYIFCQSSLQNIVFCTNFEILSFIITVLLCVIASYIIDFIYTNSFKRIKLK